jgi:Cdc6-like AAA superfamily ATPase
MSSKTVAIKNMRAGLEAFERVKSRRHTGTGALFLVVGPAGSGKTSLGKVIVEQSGGVMVRARQTWSPPAMLNDILGAVIGGHAGYYGAFQAYTALVEELRREPVSCLVIDEADYLDRGARHELLNILRDLSDETENTPIIFLSVQSLAKRLATPTNFTETVSSRIAAQVQFERLSLPDAGLLARELVAGSPSNGI